VASGLADDLAGQGGGEVLRWLVRLASGALLRTFWLIHDTSGLIVAAAERVARLAGDLRSHLIPHAGPYLR